MTGSAFCWWMWLSLLLKWYQQTLWFGLGDGEEELAFHLASVFGYSGAGKNIH